MARIALFGLRLYLLLLFAMIAILVSRFACSENTETPTTLPAASMPATQ